MYNVSIPDFEKKKEIIIHKPKNCDKISTT